MDGGASGEDATQTLISGAATRLKPSGRLHAVGVWPNVDSYDRRVAQWWGAGGGSVEGLWLQIYHSKQQPRDKFIHNLLYYHNETAIDRKPWLDNMQHQTIETMAFGYIFLFKDDQGEPRAGGDATTHRRLRVIPCDGPWGPDVLRCANETGALWPGWSHTHVAPRPQIVNSELSSFAETSGRPDHGDL